MQNEKLFSHISHTFEQLNTNTEYFLHISNLTRQKIFKLLDLEESQCNLSQLKDFEEFHKIIQVIIQWEYIHNLK